MTKPAIAYSCLRCFDRKVKCSRELPACAACIKHGQTCEYRVPAKPQRRKARAQEDILTQKLKHYEQLLEQHGIRPAGKPLQDRRKITEINPMVNENNTSEHQATSASDPSTGGRREYASSQLIYNNGRSQYLENNLWTVVTEELGSPQEALYESESDSDGEGQPVDSIDYVLISSPSSTTMTMWHPPAEHIQNLWQTYLENINPWSKLIHHPTLNVSIQKAMTHIDKLPKNLEALMFAIYAAAVLSLSDQDCEQQYGEKRTVLLSRYNNATKTALSKAKFMGSADIIVLQAFLIHLMTHRDEYDPQTYWTLSGVATRIAEGMGLHRDGSVLGLPIFETEIRRRMWWQLKLADYRSAELNGSSKFMKMHIETRNTKLPLNINDEDIYPGMTTPPTPRVGVTEMILCCLRYEAGSFWVNKTMEEQQRKGTASEGIWGNYDSTNAIVEKEKNIDELEALLASKYIRYCDPFVPIELMCTLIARGATSSMRFIARHPRRYARDSDIPKSEWDTLWKLCLRVMEGYHMAFTDKKLKKYKWHGRYYFSWQALIHVLDCLSKQPDLADADRAWTMIEELYESQPEFATDTKKAVHVAVGALCLKAYNAREQYLLKQAKALPSNPPTFIVIFRQQRAASEAKRKDQQTKEQEIKEQVARKAMIEQTPRNDTSADVQYQQQNPHLDNNSLSSEAFWYDDLGFQQPDNMDMDFMLAHDPFTDDNTMDWGQWDHLFQKPGSQ